jgi:hypothetical protein
MMDKNKEIVKRLTADLTGVLNSGMIGQKWILVVKG